MKLSDSAYQTCDAHFLIHICHRFFVKSFLNSQFCVTLFFQFDQLQQP